MNRWSSRITAWLGLAHRQESASRPAPTEVHEIAREAIQWLRNAEIDLDRCGQVGLSRLYRDRADQLERQLLAYVRNGSTSADVRMGTNGGAVRR